MILDWNSKADFLLSDICKVGEQIPDRFLGDSKIEIDGQIWSPYLENDLLILTLDTSDFTVRTQTLSTQSGVIYALTGIIAMYILGSLALVAMKPEIKESQVLETNRELVSLLFGSYGVALGSLFISPKGSPKE